MAEHQAPAVRVGLHHGPCVERDGDFFGAAVNLAARVPGQAVGGEVLLTAHTAALAPDIDGGLYEPRGRQELRNVCEPVDLFAAVQAGPTKHRLAVDPSQPKCRSALAAVGPATPAPMMSALIPLPLPERTRAFSGVRRA